MRSKTETSFKVKSKSPVGITEITWQVDETEKKYKLILKAPNTDEVFDDFVNGKYKSCSKLGVLCDQPRDQDITITLSGRRKIARIIDQICQDKNYQENTEAIKALKEFRQSLPAKQLTIPTKGKKRAAYKKNPDGLALQLGSANPTHSVQRMVNINGKAKIFKQDDYGRAVIEHEVYSSFCMEILLVDQSPAMRVVYNSQGERAGAVSAEIKDFKSLGALASSGRFPSQEKLVEGGLGRIFAVNFTEENNDGHLYNLGYVNKKAYVIDFDRAMWSITKKYFPFYETNHLDLFTVDEENIDNFPYLKLPKPTRWQVNMPNCSKRWNQIGQFVRDAYFIFLKRALLDEEVFRAIADVTLTKKTTADKIVKHKVERTSHLRAALLKSRKFAEFMRTSPDLENRLVIEFTIYNNRYKPNSPLRIDIERIKQNFKQMQESFGINQNILKGEKEDIQVLEEKHDAQTPALPAEKTDIQQEQTQDQATAKITRIGLDLIDLHNNVYSFAGSLWGGETRYVNNQKMRFAKGVAEIFDLCQEYQDGEKSVEQAQATLNSIIDAAEKAKNRRYTFFSSRRQAQTAQFYDAISALPKIP